MIGLLAGLCYVIAAVIFFMLGVEWEDGPELPWGFFFLALGLVIAHWGGPAQVEYRKRRTPSA